jgi:predicted small lipoprotein YifL
MPRPLRLVLVVAVVAFGLSGCGKRGHLDPPPDENGKAVKGAQTKSGGTKRVPITAPKRDLAIDWILG